MPILLKCKLFGRAANFSVGQQTFRSGRKLFGLAANYSARQQTVRSRIKLLGRTSNLPVGHQTFRPVVNLRASRKLLLTHFHPAPIRSQPNRRNQKQETCFLCTICPNRCQFMWQEHSFCSHFPPVGLKHRFCYRRPWHI